MTVQAILKQLKSLGNAGTKKVLLRHGAREPFFGVRIQDLKKVQKRIGGPDHELAMGLYRTGNSDAMYLAGMIAEPDRMSRKDLQEWVEAASWSMLHFAVSRTAADGPLGWEMGLKWIESADESIANTGWMTLTSVVSVEPDEELDLKAVEKLLKRIAKGIHKEPNFVRYSMNGFVIAVGCCVARLSDKAVAVAEKIGKVEVDMGETECKVPLATEYIEKVRSMGRIGRKRPMARC